MMRALLITPHFVGVKLVSLRPFKFVASRTKPTQRQCAQRDQLVYMSNVLGDPAKWLKAGHNAR